MEGRYHFYEITSETIQSLLEQYPQLLPEKLKDLEEQRHSMIFLDTDEKHTPQYKSPPHITKDGLVTLMDWKLTRGKFRPALPKLIRQNDEKAVENITSEAFKLLNPDQQDRDDRTKSVRACLDTLCKLRGVGPATASLLMSVHDPEHFPFFSDELYRWAFFNDAPGSTKATTGKGWERSIDYSAKAYLALYERVADMRERLASSTAPGNGVDAMDIEKAGYVLGKTGGRGMVDDGTVAEAQNTTQQRATKVSSKENDTGRKRKAKGPAPENVEHEEEVPPSVVQEDDPPKRRRTTRKTSA